MYFLKSLSGKTWNYTDIQKLSLLEYERLIILRSLFVYKCHLFYDHDYFKCKYVDLFIIKLLETGLYHRIYSIAYTYIRNRFEYE